MHADEIIQSFLFSIVLFHVVDTKNNHTYCTQSQSVYEEHYSQDYQCFVQNFLKTKEQKH